MAWDGTQGYVWCCCSSLAIRIVGNTLTHTYTHTHRYWARHSMVRTHSGAWIVSGRYTQWSVGRAVVHMDTRCGSFSGWSMGCTHDTQTHRQIVSRRMWTVYIYIWTYKRTMGVSTESKQRAWDGNGGGLVCWAYGRERKREGEEWWCIGGEHAQRHKQGREAWGIFNKIYTRGMNVWN